MYGEKRLGVIKENKFLMKKPTQNGIATPVIVTANKPPAKTSIYTLGKKHYETTDWLGNVRVTYTDKKSWKNGKFDLNVSSSQDYYPFGATMEGRKYNLSAYRYAFNTQERVPELNESHYTALYWEYDGRLARRWNVDPSTYSMWSFYVVNNDCPFVFIDPEGDFPRIFGRKKKHKLKLGPKIKKEKSGYVAKGGFVSESYLENLRLKAQEQAWANRLLQKVENRITWTFKVTDEIPQINRYHIIPDYGKVKRAFFNLLTSTDDNVFLRVWHEKNVILEGVNIQARTFPLRSAKSNDRIRLFASLSAAYLKRKRQEEMELQRIIEENKKMGINIPIVTIFVPAEIYKYRIYVKYE